LTYFVLVNMISFTIQGDLLKCLKDSATIIGQSAVLVAHIMAKPDLQEVANDVVSITDTIKSMIDNCNNPVCLNKALERCLADHKEVGCEQWGAIIYPKCKAGLFNVACCICEEPCPEGFRDDGLFCAKPWDYGRGVGYPWKFGDEISLESAKQRCEEENSEGCEKWGLIMYPKCKPGYHNVGCCMCSRDCPAGWTDIGVSCLKPSTYGRGVGYPWYPGDCEETKEEVKMFLKLAVSGNSQLTSAEPCSEALIVELKGAVQRIIDTKEDKKKFYQAVSSAHGVISKLQNICQLPTQ